MTHLIRFHLKLHLGDWKHLAGLLGDLPRLGIWFEVEPLPDGDWFLAVKDEARNYDQVYSEIEGWADIEIVDVFRPSVDDYNSPDEQQRIASSLKAAGVKGVR